MTVLSPTEFDRGFTGGLTDGLERFPPLITNRLLVDASSQVVDAAHRLSEASEPLYYERIFIPKNQNDRRPVLLMPPDALTYYHALGYRLAERLLERPVERLTSFGRDPEISNRFNEMVPDAPGTYVVRFDIASCYEYIDHGLLSNILGDTAADAPLVRELIGFLHRLMRRPVGLPQLSPVSDLLAEQYLQRLEGALVRKGYETARFVDEFKIRVDSWPEVAKVSETFSEVSRDFFLVPAANKTRPTGYKAWKRANDKELAAFGAVVSTVQRGDIQSSDDTYGEVEGPEIDTSYDKADPEVLADKLDVVSASKEILRVWSEDIENSDFTSELIGNALTWTLNDEELIDSEVARQVLFKYPLRINAIVRHIASLLKRATAVDLANILDTLRTSVENRHSDYAELWTLWLYRRMANADVEIPSAAVEQAQLATLSPSETVRSEALWTLYVISHQLDSEALLSIYRRCSRATSPSLAALAAIAGLPPAIVSSIEMDSAENRAGIKASSKTTIEG